MIGNLFSCKYKLKQNPFTNHSIINLNFWLSKKKFKFLIYIREYNATNNNKIMFVG